MEARYLLFHLMCIGLMIILVHQTKETNRTKTITVTHTQTTKNTPHRRDRESQVMLNTKNANV